MTPTCRPHPASQAKKNTFTCPHPCRLVFRVRRRPACFFVLKSMTSCWPGLSDVSETRLRPCQPQAQACLKQPTSNPPKHGSKSSSKPSPACPGASQGMPATSSQPTSRPSPAHQGQVFFRACSTSQPAPFAQSETGLKVCQPETSLRPSPSARLLACLTCLRLAPSLRPTCV